MTLQQRAAIYLAATTLAVMANSGGDEEQIKRATAQVNEAVRNATKS